MPSAGHGRIYGARVDSIILNATEVESLAKFNEEHAACRGDGGWPKRYNITATATGIGPSIEVTCPVCKQSKNISDMESW